MKKRMVIRKCMLLAIMPAMMLASCSKNDDNGPGGVEPGGNAPSQGESISFKVDIVPQSRMTTDVKFNHNWEEGDQIGVFAVKHGEALAASDNFINNAKLTYSSSADGAKWTADATLQWPTDGSKLDFYVYYPYDVAAVDPTKISFKIKSNQSETTEGKSNYDLSNLLMAKADNLGEGFGKGQTVDLALRHALATVQLRGGISSSSDSEKLVVYLDGCRTATLLDLSAQHATAVQPTTPTAEKITMYPCPSDVGVGTSVYRALVPAGTIASGTVMFSIERNGTLLEESDPLDADLPLTADAVTNFTLSSSPYREVTVSPTERISDKLTDEELRTITHLRVFGEMKSEDFSTIKNNMTAITHVDLGEATVENNAIPARAFQQKSRLKEFVFPRDITTIGEYAFRSCRGFTGNLNIPASVKTIGEYAFAWCSGFTRNLNIPASVTEIGEYAFYSCSGFTGNLNIPASVKTIGEHAFEECSGFNGNLNISSSVTKISSSAFFGCSRFTGNLKIPASVKIIGEYAFDGCRGFNGNLKIPSSVTEIGGAAFRNCSGFTGNLDIPSSITTIEEQTFYGCTDLTSLTIPSSVKVLKKNAFRGINSLSVTCYVDMIEQQMKAYPPFFNGNDITIYVPSTSVDIYKETDGWKDFNIQPIPGT